MGTVRNLTVKVGADLTDAQKNFAKLAKDMGKLGKQVTSVGKTLTKNLTAPVLAVGTALGALAIKAGDMADELITMSNQTGVSVETLQELKYAAKFVDVEVETMAKGIGKVTKAMGAAVDSGQEFIDIADGIQVSMYDSSGVLRDSEDVFYDTIDALSQMTNETEREIAAQKIFGKSYQDLMPLIDAGTGALSKYAEEAKKLGLVLTDEDVRAMGEFDDKMETVKATMEVLGAQLGLALMPLLEALVVWVQEKAVPWFQQFIQKVQDFIQKWKDLDPQLQNFIKKLGLIVIAAGPVITVLGTMITLTKDLVYLFGAAGIGKATTSAIGSFALLASKLGVIAVTIAALTAAVVFLIALFESEPFETGTIKAGGIYNSNYPSTTKATGATYDVGTNFVPETGLALIHKGEAVIPADQNPYNGGTNNTSFGNVVINSMIVREEADIRKIAQELFKLQKQASRGVGIA